MFQLIKIQLEIFAPLQALFPSLKIDIFCRIVPLFLLRIWNESSWKNLYPANAVSHFENRHFLTHRPPARPRGILCVEKIRSRLRGFLCVEKIGSRLRDVLCVEKNRISTARNCNYNYSYSYNYNYNYNYYTITFTIILYLHLHLHCNWKY